MKRFLTPQEKKLLRYTKDRRNAYAESRAQSRKAIALRKALANRSLRHALNVALDRSVADLDAADPAVRKTANNTWRKIPDAPLAEYVGRTLAARILKGNNLPGQASTLLRTARRRLDRKPLHVKGPLQAELD